MWSNVLLLAIDDQEFNCYALNKLLQRLNYKSKFVFSGKQALKMLKERSSKECGCRFDLVFLDCNMPDMDGFETIVNIQKMIENEEITHCHVIGATADVT